MGIFGALTTSVAGLQAESYALENISGNIANSQTTAFKRIDTNFEDLVPQTSANQQLAGSVTAISASTNTLQGSVQAAPVSTYMAINGQGFFTVQKPGSFTDNNPIFTGVNNYTRSGDFSLDKNGYLVNGAGYYLEGIPVDSTTGNPVGSIPQVLKFQNDFLPSVATTSVDYRANLASLPLTTKYSATTPGSELLRPADFGTNPQITGTLPPPFTDNSSSGTAQVAQDVGGITPIDTNTFLSGGAGTHSLTSGFTVGQTITVTATHSGSPPTVTTITFTTAGTPATSNTLPIDAKLSVLLGEIDVASGNVSTPPGNPAGTTAAPIQSTVVAGQVVLHSGTANDVVISGANLGGLGLTSPVTLNRNGGGNPGTGNVVGSDETTFLAESISGGAATAYDGNGAPVNLQFRWAKMDSAALAPGHNDVWNLFYQTQPAATGSTPEWVNAGTNFTFGSNGEMSPTIGQITLNGLSVSGVSLGNVTMNFGTGGLTQFADTNGNVQVNQLQQNGFPAGQLQSVSVDNQGRVVGAYSNGRNIDLAEVSVATFNGANFLKRLDGGAFAATNESGEPVYGKGGTVSGSSLESSNTDIADEFTKLIVTQQAYSANTKVITTANTMVSDLLNVIR